MQELLSLRSVALKCVFVVMRVGNTDAGRRALMLSKVGARRESSEWAQEAVAQGPVWSRECNTKIAWKRAGSWNRPKAVSHQLK